MRKKELPILGFEKNPNPILKIFQHQKEMSHFPTSIDDDNAMAARPFHGSQSGIC